MMLTGAMRKCWIRLRPAKPPPTTTTVCCREGGVMGRTGGLIYESSLEPVEPAAIHSERRSGYERGIVRGQKSDGRRDILGSTYHAPVHLLGARLHVRVIPQHGGVDRAWKDNVDANALRVGPAPRSIRPANSRASRPRK